MAVKNNDDVNRAAQFLPFDALKGLSKELQSRIEKRTRVPRHEFSDEKKEELSNTLVRVDKGTVVRINFYLNGHYIDIEGTVAKNNVIYHYLTIGQKKIFYDDIYRIDIVSE